MSKERLEEIRHYYREMESFDPGTQSDINWLIEQAERVQELEKERDEWKNTAQSYYMTNQELREQNKRYREIYIEIKDILLEAIESLDKNEKVQGLEWIVKRIKELEDDS